MPPQNFLQRLFSSEPKPVPVVPKEKLEIKVIEAGSSGTEIYSGYITEEYLPELQGREAARVYDKMRRQDADVKMVLRAVKGPIARANWEIEAASDSPEHTLHKEFIEHILFSDTKPGWRKILWEALTMVDFGHSVFEITHKPVLNHPRFGSYIGIKKLGWRSPRTIERWNVDRDGELKSITQYAYGDVTRMIDIPGEFLIVMALEAEGDNYEGISGLRACYGPWWRKQLYLKLLAIGTENNAVPPPVAEVPANATAEDRESAKETLEAYTSHEAQYILIPAGWKLTMQPNHFDPEKVKTCINFENTEIVRSFVANFLDLGSSAGAGGSYSLSFDQSDFFLGSLEYIADLIADPFNEKVIPALIDLKYGPQDKYPCLKHSGISDKAGKELAETLKALAEGRFLEGDLETEEHLRRRYGLPKKGSEDVRKMPDVRSPFGGKPDYPAPVAAKAFAPTLKALSEKDRALYLAELPDSAKLQFQAVGSNQCETCRSFDGKVFDRDDPDLPVLPLHPNCECTYESHGGE